MRLDPAAPPGWPSPRPPVDPALPSTPPPSLVGSTACSAPHPVARSAPRRDPALGGDGEDGRVRVDSSTFLKYEAVFAKDIPETITGGAFLDKYGDHNDVLCQGSY